ncbi:hypothetical protein PINS_up014522 [Pythium insidiosum]|nr:hypothetical protein PINS_up014522 [Pythium insidiosum]
MDTNTMEATKKTPSTPRVLLIFDFDWSLINEDSDAYVASQLWPTAERDAPEFYSTFAREADQPQEEIDCPTLFSRFMKKMVEHKPELSREDVIHAIQRIPVQPRMIDAVHTAVREHDAHVAIVSNANTVYINAWLDHHGLHHLIRDVVTNPAEFDESSSVLHVRPYCSEGHNCPWCPVNMCKGRIVEELRRRIAPTERVIYVGDGGNDFCPATILESSDVILARADDKNNLLTKIRNHAHRVKAEVVPWSTGQDVFDFFVQS